MKTPMRFFILKAIFCLFILGTFSINSQNRVTISKAIVKKNNDVVDFQKKYLKIAKADLKNNLALVSLAEKHLRKSNIKKRDANRYNAKLKELKSSLTKLERDFEKIERTNHAMGEDAQLANIELQNQLQKQQQTLQTMSNVSKAVHDTAMAIIRKIG